MRESIGAFREVFSNPGLRRIQLAWAGSNTAGWAYGVVISVYAFEVDGAYAVGLVALVRFIAAGFAAPLTSVLGDRFRRSRVMLAADVIRVVLLVTMAGLVAADAPSVVVYAISIVGTVVGTAFRPAQAALVPTLARTPQELTASNVSASTIESIGMFVGPALGGVLVAAVGVDVGLLVTAALLSWSAVLVALVHDPERPEREASEVEGVLSEVLGGFRVLVQERRLALLAGLFALQTFVDGALGVLSVVIAFELLTVDAPESWVGFLNSAAGVGGIAGAVLAAALVARGRLAGDFGIGLFLWGAPLVLLAIWVDPVVALAVFAITGVANTIVDVSGDTLLQRAVPDDVLARAFGAVEGLTLASIALGSIAAPVLLDAFGERVALVAIGGLLPVASILSWRALAAMDRPPTPEAELLRSLTLFSPLPPATIEYLAHRFERLHVEPGVTVIRSGERADRFYVVAAGDLEVHVDGAPPRALRAGDFFGEIALLREVPRTATVVAKTDAEVLAIEGHDFVDAVTGNADALRAADAVVGARLAPA